MNTEIQRIVDQVHRSFAGDAWHGPSVTDALRDVDPTAAVSRPIPAGHTIAEIVAHLELTQRVILERIEGRGRMMGDDDLWPAPPTRLTDAKWTALLHQLRDGAAALEHAIAAFPANRLDDPLIDAGTPAFNNFLGHAQHNAYHAGQIALIKKLLSAAKEAP